MRMFSPANVLANNHIMELFFDIRVNDVADQWEARCKVNGCMWGYAVTLTNTLTSPLVTPAELTGACVRHVVDDHEADYEQFKTPTPAQSVQPAEINLPIFTQDGKTTRPMYRDKSVPDFIALSSLDGWELNNYVKISLQHTCGFETTTYTDIQFKYMIIEAMQHIAEGCKG